MKKLLGSLGLCAAMGAACVIDVTDFAGKTCETAGDCPDPYVCVAARTGAGRTCEVLGRPALSDAGPDTGPVPQYCRDIQPILQANCVSSCHGADHSDGQPGFRLDYYAADGGGEPGAHSKAARIKARAADFKTMPPPGTTPAPSDAERALLARWVVGGAPLCDTPDGGLPDAGP